MSVKELKELISKAPDNASVEFLFGCTDLAVEKAEYFQYGNAITLELTDQP